MATEISIDEFTVSTKGQVPPFVRIRYRLSTQITELAANESVVVSVAIEKSEDKTIAHYEEVGRKLAIEALRRALAAMEEAED